LSFWIECSSWFQPYIYICNLIVIYWLTRDSFINSSNIKSWWLPCCTTSLYLSFVFTSSYLLWLCLFAYSSVQQIMCFSSYCVPYVASLFDCPLRFSLTRYICICKQRWNTSHWLITTQYHLNKSNITPTLIYILQDISAFLIFTKK
jgi:hypothetical protein